MLTKKLLAKNFGSNIQRGLANNKQQLGLTLEKEKNTYRISFSPAKANQYQAWKNATRDITPLPPSSADFPLNYSYNNYSDDYDATEEGIFLCEITKDEFYGENDISVNADQAEMSDAQKWCGWDKMSKAERHRINDRMEKDGHVYFYAFKKGDKNTIAEPSRKVRPVLHDSVKNTIDKENPDDTVRVLLSNNVTH
ncbi:MAG: hypothetical protein GY821_13650 [Gammaproteobacteria bacterium]|nr:hypothetical protein [Gammaproteobacteria bacterium]